MCVCLQPPLLCAPPSHTRPPLPWWATTRWMALWPARECTQAFTSPLRWARQPQPPTDARLWWVRMHWPILTLRIMTDLIELNCDVPKDFYSCTKLSLAPTLPFSCLFLFISFSCSRSISLFPQSPHPSEWRERAGWCSVCDWVWNKRYIDWALRQPHCLPSDCFILSGKWRSGLRIIPLRLHVFTVALMKSG